MFRIDWSGPLTAPWYHGKPWRLADWLNGSTWREVGEGVWTTEAHRFPPGPRVLP